MQSSLIGKLSIALLISAGMPASVGAQVNQAEEQFKQQIRNQVKQKVLSPQSAQRAPAAKGLQPVPSTRSWTSQPRAQTGAQGAAQSRQIAPAPRPTEAQGGVESWVQNAMQQQPTMAVGYNPNSGMCEQAITAAEKQYNLPPYILHAIAITESGVKGRPYPYAMNIKGRAYYASSAQEMFNIVQQHGAQSSIDVGCVQVNLKWHGKRFSNWAVLLDPNTNAQYAAFHLTELFREFGSWNGAVSAYHSRTAWRGMNYACLVSKNYGQILGDYRKGCGPSIEHLAAYLYANVRR